MSTCRSTDSPLVQKTFFRSERVFKEGEQFFFSTREQSIEGPYKSLEELNDALLLYVACCKEGFLGKRLTLANPGEQTQLSIL
ncbi:MAG: DUF6316 family protein [Pseudomonadota bacterium]